MTERERLAEILERMADPGMFEEWPSRSEREALQAAAELMRGPSPDDRQCPCCGRALRSSKNA